MNVAVKAPEVTVQVDGARISPAGVLDRLHVVSPVLNPEPVTLTEIPGSPDVGFSIIAGVA